MTGPGSYVYYGDTDNFHDDNAMVLAKILRSEVDSWLQSKHSSTWGEGFSLTKEDERERAVNWFVDQLASFGDHLISG